MNIFNSTVSLTRLNNERLDDRVIHQENTFIVDITVPEIKKLKLLKEGWILIDSTCQDMSCAEEQHMNCEGQDIEAIRFGDLEIGELFWSSIKQARGAMWQGRISTKSRNSTATLKPDSIVFVDNPSVS